MSKASEHLASVKAMIDEIGDDAEKIVENFAGDVEGHLRVIEAHLLAIVGGRRAQPVAAPVEKVEIKDVIGRPPTAGPGSRAANWRAYADVKGIEVDENATKAQIIAAVEAAEVAGDADGED